MPLLDSVAGISVGCSSVCLPATCSAAWPACCVPHAGCADSTRSCELSWLNAPAAPSSTLVAGLSTSFWNCCSCIASCALPPWPGRPAMASPRARQLPRCSALRLAPYKSPDAHMRRGMCSGVSSCDGWWSGAGSLLPLTTVVFSSMLPMLCSVVPARLLRDTLLELFIAVALAPRPLALPLAPLAPAPLGCMAAALGARLPRRRSTLQALNHDVKVARSMPCTSCTTMYTCGLTRPNSVLTSEQPASAHIASRCASLRSRLAVRVCCVPTGLPKRSSALRGTPSARALRRHDANASWFTGPPLPTAVVTSAPAAPAALPSLHCMDSAAAFIPCPIQSHVAW
mmetsp:Transcript_13184/g.38345  ORF Transcript_13184/g.38345 Transcript_13184/m.38345 type:complete len:342 (+) Transcript_13184:1936-2961(+)